MKSIIHRGTNEIGGTVLEIKKNTDRIIFDIGLPLSSMNEDLPLENYLPQTLCLKGIGGVFISHAHPDHYGLLDLIDEKTTIFMSEISKKIMLEIMPLIKKGFNLKTKNIKVIKDNETVKIGDITIIPHIVDHSAAGAFAFEIRCEGKKGLYTGDFRFHGKKKYLTKDLANKVPEPDFMFMEGTTLSRSKDDFLTEEDVYDAFVEKFKKDKMTIISFSSQNLDRLVNVYRASKKAGKTFVIDPYTATAWNAFKESGVNLPSLKETNIRIYMGGSKNVTDELIKQNKFYQLKPMMIKKEEIKENPTQFVIKDSFKLTTHFLKEENFFDKGHIIYSLWEGYLENPNDRFKEVRDKLNLIHSSGHASPKDLQDFVLNIKPKKLIPIHTNAKDEFEKFFDKTTVFVAQDCEEFDL